MDETTAREKAETTTLEPFDGMPVVVSTVAITNAGDGLSDALSVRPQEWRIGDDVYLVLHARVAKVDFAPATKDTPDLLARKHVFKAQTIAVTDDAGVKKILRDEERRKQEARGRHQLENPDGTPFNEGSE